MKQSLKRKLSFGGSLVFLFAIFSSFQNCSDPMVESGGVSNSSSTSLSTDSSTVPLSSSRPTVTLNVSPEVWRVGSGDTASVSYSTGNATSVSGYHVFTGSCALGQSQGGQSIPWAWADTTGSKTWTQVMSALAADQRDDRGCTIRYCVVASNSAGSTEACRNVQIVGSGAPQVTLTMSSTRWRIGSGETVTGSYTVQGATSTRGYHTFAGTCNTASTYPNRQEVPWDFGNNANGNSFSLQLSTTPVAGERDDRGCTVTYCVVATNAQGSVQSCVPVEMVGAVPAVSFTVTPSVWRFGSGDTVSVSYTTSGATSTRGYHVFEGTCPLAQQHPGEQVPWEFGNQLVGNSWSTVLSAVPAAGERDDRGCTIRYCIVAQNAQGPNEVCRTVSIQ